MGLATEGYICKRKNVLVCSGQYGAGWFILVYLGSNVLIVDLLDIIPQFATMRSMVESDRIPLLVQR